MNRKKTILSAGVLAAALLAGVLLYLAGHPARETPAVQPEEFMEYESAVVDQILSDSTQEDPVAEDHFRGSQMLTVTVKSGRYAGTRMLADNTVGPLFGQPLAAGDRVTVGLSTYADGTVR